MMVHNVILCKCVMVFVFYLFMFSFHANTRLPFANMFAYKGLQQQMTTHAGTHGIKGPVMGEGSPMLCFFLPPPNLFALRMTASTCVT